MKIVAISLLSLISLASFAQDEEEQLSPHMLGASISIMSGYGLTYGYFFDERNVVKAKAFAYIAKDGSNNDESHFEFGAEYQQTFFHRRFTRAYFLAGGYYSVIKDTPYDGWNGTSSNETTTTEYAAGFGTGFEYRFWTHFLLNLDVGFTYISTDRKSVPVNMYDSQNYPQTYLGLGGGIGLMYRF